MHLYAMRDRSHRANARIHSSVVGVSLGFLAFLSISQYAAATSYTWNGGTAGTWNTSLSNWLVGTTSTAWGNGSVNTATFPYLGSNDPVHITLGGNITAGGLITTSSEPYTITSSTYSLTLAGSATVSVTATPLGPFTLNCTVAGSNGLAKSGSGEADSLWV